MKMMVVYHSRTGNTAKMAEAIVAGMNSVENVEAKAFAMEEADEEWGRESKCIVVGSPIYLASISGTVKTWLETTCPKYAAGGKLGGAFATADYVHGGAELGIRTILDHLMVMGMLTYSGGGACGKPVIHLGPVALKENLDNYTETFRLYGKRMAEKAVEIF